MREIAEFVTVLSCSLFTGAAVTSALLNICQNGMRSGTSSDRISTRTTAERALCRRSDVSGVYSGSLEG
jgi:hypothetical protein